MRLHSFPIAMGKSHRGGWEKRMSRAKIVPVVVGLALVMGLGAAAQQKSLYSVEEYNAFVDTTRGEPAERLAVLSHKTYTDWGGHVCVRRGALFDHRIPVLGSRRKLGVRGAIRSSLLASRRGLATRVRAGLPTAISSRSFAPSSAMAVRNRRKCSSSPWTVVKPVRLPRWRAARPVRCGHPMVRALPSTARRDPMTCRQQRTPSPIPRPTGRSRTFA